MKATNLVFCEREFKELLARKSQNKAYGSDLLLSLINDNCNLYSFWPTSGVKTDVPECTMSILKEVRGNADGAEVVHIMAFNAGSANECLLAAFIDH